VETNRSISDRGGKFFLKVGDTSYTKQIKVGVATIYGRLCRRIYCSAVWLRRSNKRILVPGKARSEGNGTKVI
jgi:hypothetical protein